MEFDNDLDATAESEHPGAEKCFKILFLHGDSWPEWIELEFTKVQRLFSLSVIP